MTPKPKEVAIVTESEKKSKRWGMQRGEEDMKNKVARGRFEISLRKGELERTEESERPTLLRQIGHAKGKLQEEGNVGGTKKSLEKVREARQGSGLPTVRRDSP